MLRRGSAGSNTAADHLRLLGAAIAAMPPAFRRKLMVTCDGAGASHALVKRPGQAGCPPRLRADLLGRLGAGRAGEDGAAAWSPSRPGRSRSTAAARSASAAPMMPAGTMRLRAPGVLDRGSARHRADRAAARRPGRGPAAGLARAMRVFARRERPHPGAQLTLFEAGDGWRYSLWATNRPAATKGWLGQAAYIDAAHRVHARVEDAIRTGKDCGIGHFPSFDFGINTRVADRVDDRADPARLAQAPGPGRRPGQSRAEDAALPRAARRRPPGPRRAPPNPENPGHLAVGRGITTAWQRIDALPQAP